MGFWSRTGKVVGGVFNFRVDKWIGYQNVKEGFTDLKDSAISTFKTQKAERIETFEEALQRLKITEEDLNQRKKEFRRLVIIYLLLSILLLAYSIYILIFNNNFGGFAIAFALTLYTIINAFKFHFWLFQIRKRKLGCTIKEWFNS